MELLGTSLGVGRSHFREFFEGNDSIMRLNYYPPCQKPDQTLGTGPHCDPTSLTILHQDEVSGLQVFVDGKWYSVSPNPDTFVVNIGDTFMVRNLTPPTKTCTEWKALDVPKRSFVWPCACPGSIKWDLQELLAQGGGEWSSSEEVSGFLSVPKKGQGGDSTESIGR